jgi:glutamate 5-kinase
MNRERRRIVVKFGSGILTLPGSGAPEAAQFDRFAAEIADLVAQGHEMVIVSSGAVAAGMEVLGLTVRPAELIAKQACAAVGQSRLMQLYDAAFAKRNLHVAQLLVTHGDLDSRIRHFNAGNTLRCLLQRGTVVPIINENDSVATEELKFGDNDRLSAEVAVLAQADLLILLTSVDGLFDPDGQRLSVVEDVEQVSGFARAEKGDFSVGGMVSKLQAVKEAVNAGISTVIANGRTPGAIEAVIAGEDVGTRFVAG